MRRPILLVCLGLLLVFARARAEEIVLKDGTKIRGRMVAIKGDSIEVQTAYGKMKISRSNILSINFPENQSQPETKPEPEPKRPARPVEEKLEGTSYTNRTGKFTLTVPIEWKINKQVGEGSDALAGLSSRGEMQFLMVAEEDFSGTLEGYKGIMELQWKRTITQYEKLAESSVTIDGRQALIVVFRGINPDAAKLPFQYLVAFVPYENQVVRLAAWCVEPLFNESQRTFEKIVLSYKRIPE